MSYTALINAQLDKAFKLVKDLADDVLLTKKSGTSFDFSTLAVAHATSATVPTKGIFTDKVKKSSDQTKASSTMLLKTKDVGDISLYDSLTVNGETWRIAAPIAKGKFTVLVNVLKEA